ncbi:MAG TPA: NAD(P)/FAD-dependent oxidoreductase [Bacteriovoracaceae bacterium]|nr:NAD(P)/FAD-dependent oxidoreductase [Bacteriovoracaceae bacterium]
MKTPRVVIVGGGFGGLSAAKSLGGKNAKVTLVDKRNYHLFQPLLYQVAMAALSPAEIAYPLRQLLAGKKNVNILLGEVAEINKEEKWIKTESNKIDFDYLILACGATYTYFNSPQWEPFAPGLKTIAQATEIRRRVFLAFEKAERESDPEKQKPLLTFVVVGGGPTGVELAGALGEITRYSITKDFHHIKPQLTRIILIEAGKRILPTMSDALSMEAVRELEQLGVQVWTNSKVTEINETGIRVGNEFIESITVLWAAGVGANPLNKLLGAELDRQGRVVVKPDTSITGHPDIFVIGDQAHFKYGLEESPLPGLAPVAMQQGRFVATNILRESKGKNRKSHFHYVDKGQMATIGRSRAVGMFKGLEFQGFIAWMGWLFVHIYYLIGFKNRIFVLFQWSWTYLTFRRGARLIIDKN